MVNMQQYWYADMSKWMQQSCQNISEYLQIINSPTIFKFEVYNFYQIKFGVTYQNELKPEEDILPPNKGVLISEGF